jgi:hypothetical protein
MGYSNLTWGFTNEHAGSGGNIVYAWDIMRFFLGFWVYVMGNTLW